MKYMTALCSNSSCHSVTPSAIDGGATCLEGVMSCDMGRSHSGDCSCLRYSRFHCDRHSFEPSLCTLWSLFPGNGILTPETRGRKWPRVFRRRLARDQAPTRKPVNSRLFAMNREISVRRRLRGGAERTRTTCQARSSIEPVSVTAPILEARTFRAGATRLIRTCTAAVVRRAVRRIIL
jgi:hypothetical protein